MLTWNINRSYSNFSLVGPLIVFGYPKQIPWVWLMQKPHELPHLHWLIMLTLSLALHMQNFSHGCGNDQNTRTDTHTYVINYSHPVGFLESKCQIRPFLSKSLALIPRHTYIQTYILTNKICIKMDSWI